MDMKCTLKDCGFQQEIANKYKEVVEAENYFRQIQVLEMQRKLVLDDMHTAAKKLDCIDFLICECKKKLRKK